MVGEDDLLPTGTDPEVPVPRIMSSLGFTVIFI